MKITVQDYQADKNITLTQSDYELLYQALAFANNSTMFLMSDEIADRMETLLTKLPKIDG